MWFNSLRFLWFFPLTAALFFACPRRLRWVVLLAASYYFYACWSPAYLALIALTTATAYSCSLMVTRCSGPRARAAWLWLNVGVSLGILFFFKYYNFLAENLRALGGLVPLLGAVPDLGVLLPVGVSFYTFQALSYSIDVYRGDRPAERHAGILSLYIAFFPQLVAGPIERSTRLLPQFRQRQRFDYSRVMNGVLLMAWGLFMKVVIADGIAPMVNRVYRAPERCHGAALAVATALFGFQIYCDFGGYSAIAIGAARVLGFDLMRNFDAPYLATSLGQFWRRWHISLSTWFRDYVYVPLGGSRGGASRTLRNILVVFLLSGLWHGAAWTYVLWGAGHAILLSVERLLSRRRCDVREPVRRPWAGAMITALRWGATFTAVTYLWVLFRAESLADAVHILVEIPRGLGQWVLAPFAPGPGDAAAPPISLVYARAAGQPLVSLIGIAILLVVEGVGRRFGDRCRTLLQQRWIRLGVLLLLIEAILLFGSYHGNNAFIYFQF